jgi:hypothetical protein
MTQNSPEEDEEEEARNDDASITSDDQSHPSTRPRQDEYLRGSSHGRQEREVFDDDVSNRSRSRSADGNPEYGLPFLNFAMC